MSEAELSDALVAAALPAIDAFRAAHPDERFVGFAVEVLAEERYFHLCAQTFDSEDSEPRAYSETAYLLPEDIDSNCQEWPYFDFNSRCNVWQEHWAPTKQRIKADDEAVRMSDSDEDVQLYRDFTATFWHASLAAFARLVDSDAVRALPKGSCFVTFIYEHHDVF